MFDFHSVLSAARALSDEERMLLVDILCEEAAPESWPLPDQETIAEAARRSDEYDRGETTAVSAREALARLKSRAGFNG